MKWLPIGLGWVAFFSHLLGIPVLLDRQLTTNFKLWVEIFCVPTCFHVMIPKQCLSVPREMKSPWLRQYQSYISNWYINGKVFTSTTQWKNKNLNFFSKKFEIEFWLVFWLFTSTTAWRPKNLNFFSQKSLKLNFDLCWQAEIILASSISFLHW